MNIFPKTSLGKWTVSLAVLAFVAFIVWRIGLATKPVQNTPGPPLIAFNWFVFILYDGLLTLIVSILGLLSIIIQKERSLSVILITVVGFLTLLITFLVQYFDNMSHF